MSLTIQQIITDAKRLANRLKERDLIADSLLHETHVINKKIDAMKQFQDEVEHLNKVANQKPHSQLIANIQKENRHLREIQQENRELRAALEDYQNAGELIMTKYREHTQEQVYRSRIDFREFQQRRYRDVVRRQAEKIEEMAAVMQRAAAVDERKDLGTAEVVARLQAENQGLREMVDIAWKCGSLKTADKNIQTDNDTSE